MRRIFWMSVGAGLAVYGMRRAQRLAESVTPRSLAGRAAQRAMATGGTLRALAAEVQAGMAEREAELRGAMAAAQAARPPMDRPAYRIAGRPMYRIAGPPAIAAGTGTVGHPGSAAAAGTAGIAEPAGDAAADVGTATAGSAGSAGESGRPDGTGPHRRGTRWAARRRARRGRPRAVAAAVHTALELETKDGR